MSQVLQHRLCIFPADAGVGDTDAILEAGLALCGNLLVAWVPGQLSVGSTGHVLLTLVNIALDHNAHDSGFTGGDLLAEDSRDLGLVLMVLLRVSVAAVDHDTRREAVGFQLGLRLGYALRIVVGAFLSSAEDNEAVGVTDGADDGDDTGLGDGEEVVGVFHRADGVDGDVERAVGAVLETDGEGQTRGQLAVDLGLGGARADSADGEAVVQELGGDGIQHLAGDGHALVRQIGEQLARGAETLVDLEAVIDVGVVDQTLPSDRRTGLLEVRAHDDQQVVAVLLLQLHKAVTVFKGHCGVVDRAGADDYQETLLVRVSAVHDGAGVGAALQDRLARLLGQCDLMLEEVWWGQRVVSPDC